MQEEVAPSAQRAFSRSNHRHTEAEFIKLFGQRAEHARNLCGLTQVEAAKQLGFEGSSNLSKMERGVNGGSVRTYVPLSTIVKMASLYEVSTDYLLGLTDDWEPDARLTERTVANYAYADMQVIVGFDQKVRSIAVQAGGLANLVCSLWFAVRDLHEEQKQKGAVGDSMLKAVELGQRSFSEATKCRRMLEKLKLHKKDNAAQLVLTLISEPVVDDGPTAS